MKNTKTLIALSIILLTTLSATLFEKQQNSRIKEVKLKAEDSLIIKIDQFDAKTYRATYEKKKRARQMRIDSIKKL